VKKGSIERLDKYVWKILSKMANEAAIGTTSLPAFVATVDATLASFQISQRTYLDNNPKVLYKSTEYHINGGMASGAVVITTADVFAPSGSDALESPHISTGPQQQKARVLLVRRAPTDSMPNLWEVPGGAVDFDDPTILHGAARELWEEAGLRATAFHRVVGPEHGQVFATRRGRLFVKVHFLVDVKAYDVQLDANEHSDFCWATEAECEVGQVSRVIEGQATVLDIPFTTEAQKAAIMAGFEAWRKVQAAVD
jgi:8-oxo-dGTP pyrophosphatase MutT (NUDIX family)